jgi:hypothetical protein
MRGSTVLSSFTTALVSSASSPALQVAPRPEAAASASFNSGLALLYPADPLRSIS